MVSFMTVVAAAAALLPAAFADPDHFILSEVNSLVQARIDPIINSGRVGSHVHNIMGASNFGTGLKHPDNLVGGAECSTVMVQDDKSNYWTPTMYYIHDNGTYEAMLAGARIYYFLKNPKVQPWPKGMRIVSGNAMSRDENDIRSLGVDLTCGETYGTRHLPNGTSHDYCDSIHAGIYFPSCGWANQSLDSWDHFSHLTWPVERGGGREWVQVNGANCPESHPIKYPTMFIQHFYRFDEFRPWRKGRNNVVFSNGDLLGSSFHGDFVNGWKDGVLESVVDQCKTPHGPGDLTDKCAPLHKSHDTPAARNCAYQGMIPKEDVGIYRAIDKLPGCNPLWPVEAGDAKPKCDGGSQPGWVKPNIGFSQGFNIRLPLYLANVVPESLRFNYRDWKAGLWGLYGAADKIQKPADTAEQTESPSDSIAGSQLNADGPVFDQEQPLDAPTIMEQEYATFPAGQTGTPAVTYKGMPGNVDMLGNTVKPTGSAAPDLDTGDKQANAQPTAAPGFQFSEEDHKAAQNASAPASSGSSASSATSPPAAAPTPDENSSWLDVPKEEEEEEEKPASPATTSTTSGSAAPSATSIVSSASPAGASITSSPSSAAAAPTSANTSEGKPKLGPNGKKCRPKGHKKRGHARRRFQ